MQFAQSVIVRFLTATLMMSAAYAQGPAVAGVTHVKVGSIPARAEDVSTLNGMIKAYYETGSGPAGQPRQWARDRTLYAPDVRILVYMNEKNGKAAWQQYTYQEFADMADPSEVRDGFFEREIHRITYRYGSWAHIISTSEGRRTPAGPVTGRGIDNVELFWDGARWWITTVSIVEESPEKPLPKDYLP